MSSNKKIQVMENFVECMNTHDIYINLNELKRYQYIDLKNKTFSILISKLFQDYNKQTDENLEEGLYKQLGRYRELYVDKKHFKLLDYNFIKVIENVKEKISEFIAIPKNKNDSKLKNFFKENFNYEILYEKINFEKIKNDIKEKNLSKLNEIHFFLKNPNKTFINLFINNISYLNIYNNLKEFFKNNFEYEIINGLLDVIKIDESKIKNYLKDISKSIKYNNEMLDDVIDLFFSKIENIKNISETIKYNNAMLDDIIKLFFIKIETTKNIEYYKKNIEVNKKKLDDIKKIKKNTEEDIKAKEEDIKAKEEIIKVKKEIIKAKEEDIRKYIKKDTIDLFFNKINLNDNNLKQKIKYLFNNIVYLDISTFFDLYYGYKYVIKKKKNNENKIHFTTVGGMSGASFRLNNDVIYFFNTKNKYLIIKTYLDFIHPLNSCNNAITCFLYVDIETFFSNEKKIYLFFKIKKFEEEYIKKLGNILTKNGEKKNIENIIRSKINFIPIQSNIHKNKDFYILSFNENAKNYTERDSNDVINKIIELNPSVLIICTQESGSGITSHFQKILQKRLNGSEYKLISHQDESKTIIKIGNKNVRTYFYVNMDKINFGDEIKRKFKTIGIKRLFISENRNVTKQERNDENKSIELINYEWTRSKESFGYKGANKIGRVMKGTIYKGAICLKITLKYNGLEHSFIVVNTNFSNNNKKKDQFDSVCKEFNLYNQIDNSTIFFCGDLNFDIKTNFERNNELNKFFKTGISVSGNNNKIKNLYEKFLECTKSIKIRLPNRIIYAISDKDKYDVYINKDGFYNINIKIKNNASQPIINSFGFNFFKNNGEKYKKIIENITKIKTIENIEKIKTIQNITEINNIIQNINSKNHKVLFYINGINNIFEEITGENFDEFIYCGEHNIDKNEPHEKSNLTDSRYIEDIYINGIQKSNNSQINNLIKKSGKQNILENIFSRDTIFTSYKKFNKILSKLDENQKNILRNEKRTFYVNQKIILRNEKRTFYVNHINNKLFILYKEYFGIRTGQDNNYNKIIYSFISYIFCDIESNKFYIFIKPVIKIIDFTDFFMEKESSDTIKKKIDNYEKNYKK